MTIRDIAKIVGVSSATVSRVINESGYVKEETKNRILDMQLCGEPMRTDIVGRQEVRKKPMDLAI